MLSVTSKTPRCALARKENTKGANGTTASITRENNSADCAMSALQQTKSKDGETNGSSASL